MNTKELIIQELEELPESSLLKVLESVRQLKRTEASDSRERIWQAYLESEQENEAVYRRLADA